MLDQLEVLQHKLTNLQARMRLNCRGRARSAGRLGLTCRASSTVSLGDPTRGEMTTPTPRLDSTDDTFLTRVDQLNETPNQSVNNLTGTVNDDVGMKRTCVENDDDAAIQSEQGVRLLLLDSGLDVDLDGEHTSSISGLFADVSDSNSMFTERDKHHLAVELAETKARLRRIRGEM